MENIDLTGIDCVVLRTGNILNLDEILRKTGQEPENEVFECVKSTLSKPQIHKSTPKLYIDSMYPLYKDETDSSSLLTTVKVFLGDVAVPSDLQLVLKEVTEYLGRVDCLILSLGGAVGFDQKLAAWRLLETLVPDGTRIGVSDEDDFIRFYSQVSVKPSILQLNISSCCVVPPELDAFAKDNEVQLLTHSDPKTIAHDQLAASFPTYRTSRASTVKFTSHIKCRGVLATKGYLIIIPN